MAKGSIALLALVLLMSGCMVSVPTRPQLAPSLATMTVVDDAMNTSVIVRSSEIEQTPNGDLRSDLRLNAAIDRASGRVVYLVSFRASHSMGGWMFPSSATYLDERGQANQASGFRRAQGDVDGCGRFGCNYREGATFEIPRETLDGLVTASGGRDGLAFWRVRVVGQRATVDGGVATRHIGEFLYAVDQQTARLRTAQTASIPK